MSRWRSRRAPWAISLATGPEPAATPAALAPAVALWLALAFMALNAAMSAAFVPFPSRIDELQHYSFLRWMELHPSLLPRYDTLRSLKPDLSGWDGPAAITHPAPYYLAMAVLDRLTHSVAALRAANAALSLAGAALMILAGYRVLASDAEKLIHAALVALYPKIGLVAGLINNDNLAFLAAGLGFLALLRWRERPGDPLMALALALAGWTKLTVLLMLASSFVVAELLSGARPGRRHLTVVAGGLVGAVPSLVNLARYGSVVWHGVPAHPLQHPLAAPVFLARAVWQFASSWSALEPSNPLAVLGLTLVLALGAYACVRGWRGQPVAVGMMLSLVPIVVLQLWFTWREAQRYHFLDELDARYYYGLWPGFALGLARLWPLHPGPARWIVAGVTGACLLAGSAAFCIGLVVLVGRTVW